MNLINMKKKIYIYNKFKNMIKIEMNMINIEKI